MARGEVRAERNASGKAKYCLASCQTPIDSAEVDRWRKLAAIPDEDREPTSIFRSGARWCSLPKNTQLLRFNATIATVVVKAYASNCLKSWVFQQKSLLKI